MPTQTIHQHEKWQIRVSASGGFYCAACGEKTDGPEDLAERDRMVAEAAWEEGKQALAVYLSGGRKKIPYPTNPYKKTRD